MVKYAPKIERISKYTKEDIAEAKANGVSYSAFLGRINRGWSVSQAVNTPTHKRQLFTTKELNIMKKNGVTKKMFHLRISRGYPREVALSHPPNKHFVGMERTAYKKTVALNFKERVYKNDKPKPWLEKYPQKTKFGDYAKQLFNDCCGTW
ncbi:hypothetical protein [Mammaliicoccus sciuri]|uniref:hypothetical protein n=1 Tax=Mammaliicoccus sciuri TaxID=1296 RepID=UPI003F569EFD